MVQAGEFLDYEVLVASRFEGPREERFEIPQIWRKMAKNGRVLKMA
jgi:hypothetical protein